MIAGAAARAAPLLDLLHHARPQRPDLHLHPAAVARLQAPGGVHGMRVVVGRCVGERVGIFLWPQPTLPLPARPLRKHACPRSARSPALRPKAWPHPSRPPHLA